MYNNRIIINDQFWVYLKPKMNKLNKVVFFYCKWNVILSMDYINDEVKNNF